MITASTQAGTEYIGPVKKEIDVDFDGRIITIRPGGFYRVWPDPGRNWMKTIWKQAKKEGFNSGEDDFFFVISEAKITLAEMK